MQTFGGELVGNQRTLPRTKLLQQLKETPRPGRIPRRGGKARAPGRRAPESPADRGPVQGAGRNHEREAGEPARGGFGGARPDRGAVRRGGGRPGAALRVGPGARERLRAVRGARGSWSRWRGRGGDGMTEALVPAAAAPATGGGGEVVLPQVIVDAGPQATARFLEFFAGRIANARTRAAYGRAVGQFLAWCEARGLGLREVSPLHVAAYIRTHPGSAPTVKQHLAAIRMLGDWLVVNQVLPVNPAAAVRGPKHVVTKGATPVLSPAEARKRLRVDRHGRAGRAPGPGAALRHALQLRAGERGVGDEAAELLRAGEPGLVEAPREGREAARRAGPPPGRRGPRRVRRGGRARGAEGGALPEHGPGGAPADGPGARAAGRPGDDQAARRRRGAPALDVLPHVPTW